MNSAWSIELARLFAMFASSLLLGLISGQWLLSVVIHTAIYIGWNLYQLKIFEQWISNGSSVKSAPDTSGVWALIVQQFYRSQKTNKDRKKHLVTIANHYHAVMSALPNATIVLNSNFEIEWANKPSHEFLGIDVVRDVGHPIGNIVRDINMQKLLSENSPQADIEMISPVDHLKTLNIQKLEYTGDKTLLIARDVSQRIAIQKLRKAFVANASHELRTPLTVISGYLETLDSDEDLSSEVADVINRALHQAFRMEKILNNLLILSKLEEKGASDDKGRTINVIDIIGRLVNEISDNNVNSSPQFVLNSDPSLNIKMVEQEFYSLVHNLLSNAVKYSRINPLIKISWSQNSEDYVCLSVTDQGEGIADKHLKRLTERFYRVNVERERKVHGTGLGLSIVKHILDNHKGYLEIESQLNIGSTFTACFPSSLLSAE